MNDSSLPAGLDLGKSLIEMSNLTPKWTRLDQNVTNPGLLQIRFSTFWFGQTKCTETDLKKSQMEPIKPTIGQNLPSLGH